jgi:glycosyl transferase family 25
MENGAVGCSMSHLKLLQQAFKNKLDHILIVEDDIHFLDTKLFEKQLDNFLKGQTSEWDVILFAGNNMPPYQKVNDTCVKVSRCQTTTGYLINGHYIEKLMNNVKIGLTNLIREPEKHTQYAIDRHWFALQEVDNWFLITPLTVVQREDYSDIEKRVTNYIGVMTDLDKKEILKKMKVYDEKEKKQEEYNSMINKFKNRMNLA